MPYTGLNAEGLRSLDLSTGQTGLTGKYRFRSGLFGRMVLQVQFYWTGMPAYSRTVVTEPRWRDATALDLSDPQLRALVDGGRV